MRIRILGAGWYGCSIGSGLLNAGHDVEIHETRKRIFDGASGRIPARLHIGAHYPRSRETREACQRHTRDFMRRYGFLTRMVPVNVYAVARNHSLVDFKQYLATLRGEFEFITIEDPTELGIWDVEGAILTGERHILANRARDYFEEILDGHIRYSRPPGIAEDKRFDLTIDCTFCANDGAGVDRYEPCLVLALEGPTDRAVTIMDGPFGSLYPWDPDLGLCSLSSAQWTPFSKTCKTYEEAQALLDGLSNAEISAQAQGMIDQMRGYYPAIDQYRVADHMLSIRAMPLSGADSRLVDVVQVDEKLLRVRAGKIDAVIDAERIIHRMISELTIGELE